MIFEEPNQFCALYGSTNNENQTSNNGHDHTGCEYDQIISVDSAKYRPVIENFDQHLMLYGDKYADILGHSTPTVHSQEHLLTTCHMCMCGPYCYFYRGMVSSTVKKISCPAINGSQQLITYSNGPIFMETK